MRAVLHVACFVAALWIPFVAADGAARAPKSASAIDALASANPRVAALLLFNAVNALICVWEIALWTYRHDVRRMHQGYVRKFGKKRLPTPVFLFEDITLKQALSLSYWKVVFAQYASLDPSYADHASWGFWIDCGNGFTMLVPSIALSIAVTGFPHIPAIAALSPRTIGILTVVMNYQMFYGTVIYFANFRYQGHDVGASTATNTIVVLSNAIWLIGPLAWMYHGVRFIHTDSLAIA